jgi:hypothetical protein
VIENVEIFRKAGAFAAWPANYGLWIWGNEILALFIQGFKGAAENLHARDKSRPFVPRQARSFDGGRSWRIEPFNGRIPGGETLSGDEHVVAELQSGPRIDATRDLPPLDRPVDFTDPETIILCARTDLGAGSVSWFYVSRDRGQSWQGPYRLGDFGQPGISARTDVVPLAKNEALFFLTAAKANGHEGRVFCARTRDGGESFEFSSWVTDEPEGFAIMPASLRLPDGGILSAIRCSTPGKGPDRKAWIDLYRSDDAGHSWHHIGRPVPNTGYGGNPPTLNRLADGRLVMVFGFRDAPYGIRAKVSADDGASWSEDIVLRADGGGSDLGYPRTVVRPDGRLVTVYYFNEAPDGDRFIAATIFDVP